MIQESYQRKCKNLDCCLSYLTGQARTFRSADLAEQNKQSLRDILWAFYTAFTFNKAAFVPKSYCPQGMQFYLCQVGRGKVLVCGRLRPI